MLEKHQINQSEMSFTLVVDEKPLYVGIDPYNKLIDRNSDNNIGKVTFVDADEETEK
jgi:hypothetical protein